VRRAKAIAGTVYRRGNRWAFMLDLGPDPLTGKRRQSAKSGYDTEAAAWAALVEVNHELTAGRHVRASKKTVREFFNEWLPMLVNDPSVKPTTEANYEDYARAYVLPHIGDRLLQSIDPDVLTALYQHLARAGRRKADTNSVMYAHWKTKTEAGERVRPADLAEIAKVTYSAAWNALRRYQAGRIPETSGDGLAPKTVRNVHIMLRRAFNDAVAMRYISRNPATAVKAPAFRRKPHTTWRPEQLTRFLAEAKSERLYAMWVLFATTGMRRSEAVGARCDAVDLDHLTIAVHDTRVVVRGRAEDSDGKTRTSRRILALDPATVAVLRAHLAQLAAERAEWGASYQDHGKLFCWEDGRPIHPDTITEHFNRIVDRANLPTIELHAVRHTYATTALRAGINPKLVSARLGHSSVAFTLDTYTDSVPELDRTAAEQVSRLFFTLPDPTAADTDQG
jgi:integrase